MAKEDFCPLTEHTGYLSKSTNIGVVWGDSLLFIIDSGDSEEFGISVVNDIQALFPGKQVKAVINTHGHSDHVGGNLAIKSLTGAQIWAPPTESIFIENPALVPDIYWGGRHFCAMDTPVYTTAKPCKVDRLLTGEAIDAGDTTIKPISLPGHFYDQVGILVTEKQSGKKTFFLGDAFFGIKVIKKYWIPFMQDEQLFRESIEKIENTDADFYIPSHGEKCTREQLPALAEVNKLITLETETLILKTLSQKPRCYEEILKAVADFAGLKMRFSQYILIGTTIRSYLSRLYNNGKVTCEMQDNSLIWKAL